MLTTLPYRVSALFADPFHAALRELNGDFGGSDGEKDHMLRRAAPLSVWEDESAFYIGVDVPGVSLADLDVSLEKGKLTIRGDRKAARATSDYGCDERLVGQFERIVVLNEWIVSDSIVASLEDGVLSLQLTKRPESQRQKVAIHQGGAINRNGNRIESEKVR